MEKVEKAINIAHIIEFNCKEQENQKMQTEDFSTFTLITVSKSFKDYS